MYSFDTCQNQNRISHNRSREGAGPQNAPRARMSEIVTYELNIPHDPDPDKPDVELIFTYDVEGLKNLFESAARIVPNNTKK